MALHKHQDEHYTEKMAVRSEYIDHSLYRDFKYLNSGTLSHDEKVENRYELAVLEARMIGTVLQKPEAREALLRVIENNKDEDLLNWLNKIIVTSALITHWGRRSKIPPIRLANPSEKAEHGIDFFVDNSPVICVPTTEHRAFYYISKEFDKTRWVPLHTIKAGFLEHQVTAKYWGCSTSYGVDPLLMLIPIAHADFTKDYIDLKEGILY